MVKLKDQKCAPSKQYEDGSCYTLQHLKDIVRSYNEVNKGGGSPFGKIELKDDKQYLVKELEKRLSSICQDQLCWLNQSFVKKIRDKDLHENTFVPQGPKGKKEWLSTLHIQYVLKQYENLYKDFKFHGAVPMDFDDLPYLGIKEYDYGKDYQNEIYRHGIVFNLDEHYKPGSHWVAMFFDLKKGEVYYFDSVAKRPEKRVRRLAKRIVKWLYKNRCHNSTESICQMPINMEDSVMHPKKKHDFEKLFNISYNRNQHQFKDTECGVYCINFIVRMLSGETFDQICGKKTLDDDMNKYREIYFR